MWEFMVNYAESFWKMGDYAFDIFGVIIAWAITIAMSYFIFIVIIAIAQMIRDNIKEKHEEKKNGKK